MCLSMASCTPFLMLMPSAASGPLSAPAMAIDTVLNQRDQNVVCVYCAIGQRASAVAKAVAMNQMRHVKHSSKTHRTHVAKIASKHASKSTGKSIKRTRVHTAKLPMTRTGTN